MFLVATPHNYSSNMYPHRPSSPLNPNSATTNHMGSSSPLTSPMAGPSHLPSTPTPFNFSGSAPSFFASSSSAKRPSPSGTFSTRYTRPLARARHSYPADSPHRAAGGGGDLFSTEGTTPVEGAMWKERFSRRMEERSRRKAAREEDLRRRRSLSTPGAGSSSPGMSVEEEEEADRRAQEDDEEIFRRLVILQRRRAEHAALASLERETGGSDPLLPEFWEEEERNMQMEERALISHFEEDGGDHRMSSPLQTPIRGTGSGLPRDRDVQSIPEVEENEDELWALEAAQAEEAERDAEEAEIARRMEEQYYGRAPARTRGGEEVDWEALDAMAMDID